MGWINASKKNKLGNVVNGLLTIIDGVLLTVTIGNYTSNLALRWNVYRRNKGVLCDKIKKNN